MHAALTSSLNVIIKLLLIIHVRQGRVRKTERDGEVGVGAGLLNSVNVHFVSNIRMCLILD